MNKLSDNEIIKALECCNDTGFSDCDYCPFWDVDCSQAKYGLYKLALGLINKQKAEIKMLQNEKCIYNYDGEVIDYCAKPCPNYKTEQQIKSDAIKEFAERLKWVLTEYPDCYFKEPVTSTQIDNLVNEMVGEV